MTKSEEKIKKIIDDADDASLRCGTRWTEGSYLKENMRRLFLEIHLKAALETIEHNSSISELSVDFYSQALAIRTKELKNKSL